MNLRQHLKEQLDKDYELLKEFEDKLRTEIDPRLKLKWNAEIEDLKLQIRQREEELESLSTSSIQPKLVSPVTSPPTPQSPEGVEPQVQLISAKGIDYGKLEQLLAQRRWKEADRETTHLMLLVGQKNNKGFLDENDIKNFPCEDLRTIDKLWVTYSNGKFGFSVQKQIWLDCGGKIGEYDYDTYREFNEIHFLSVVKQIRLDCDGKIGEYQYAYDAYIKFCDRVEWRKGDEWLNYNNLFEWLSATVGHLPCTFHFVPVFFWHSRLAFIYQLCLFSRAEMCRL